MDKSSKKITIKKQQWSKYLANYIAEQLRKSNPDSSLKKSYMNSFNCNATKNWSGEKLTASYCKNRWCPTCGRIRTAINIHYYASQISEFQQPCFVTLTRPTCTIEELPQRIKEMEECWRSITSTAKQKKGYLHKQGFKFMGIRKMECTIRPDDKYHYHFHIICNNWYVAEWLIKEWLKRNPDASPKAQDMLFADHRSLKELFKYQTKVVASDKSSKSDYIDFKRLDKLFCVLRGKRTLAPFGGLKTPPKSTDEDFDTEGQIDQTLILRLGIETSTWIWQNDIHDWLNKSTGELLIGEEIPERVMNKIPSQKQDIEK